MCCYSIAKTVDITGFTPKSYKNTRTIKRTLIQTDGVLFMRLWSAPWEVTGITLLCLLLFLLLFQR